MARGSHWCLVRISTFVAEGRSRASEFWEVGRTLVQVGQRDCVLLADWPVKLSLQSWTLIIWEGQREQGLRLAHKLVHVAFASHLWREGCQGRYLCPASVENLEALPLLMVHKYALGPLYLPHWFFLKPTPFWSLFTSHLNHSTLGTIHSLSSNFTREPWDLHFLFSKSCREPPTHTHHLTFSWHALNP